MIKAISKGKGSEPLQFAEELHCILAQSLVFSLQLLDLTEDLLGNLACLREAHPQSLVLIP